MADAASAYSATNAQTRSTSWSLPQLTFTQGLLIGQLSIILVVVALIRYLLFEDAAPQLVDDEDEEQPQSGKVRREDLPGGLIATLSFLSLTSAILRPFTLHSGLTASLSCLVSAESFLSPIAPVPFPLFCAYPRSISSSHLRL
jgi:hypothetical protein